MKKIFSILLAISFLVAVAGMAYAESAYAPELNKRTTILIDDSHQDAADAGQTEVAAIATSSISISDLILQWKLICTEPGKSVSAALFDVASPTAGNLTTALTFSEAEAGGVNDTDIESKTVFPFPKQLANQLGIFYSQGRSLVEIMYEDK